MDAIRTCSTCQLEFPATTEFFYKNGGCSTLHPSCKKCEKERMRWKDMKRNYGLSKEQFYELCVEQNFSCKICNHKHEDERTLCVDHDHETGKVRGLLCRKCNIALGHVNDDVSILRNMIAYLT